MELETFKTYIKTNLINNFIWLSKSSIKSFLIFFRKLNYSFYIYINY